MRVPMPHWLRERNRWAIAAGVVGSAVLALSTTASLGGFTASVTNTGDKAQSGSLIMQEQVTPTGGTTTTCLSTGTGTAITTNANSGCTANKFGALTNTAPGASSFSTVVITNQGSLAANTFSMGVGACTATPTAPPGPPPRTSAVTPQASAGRWTSRSRTSPARPRVSIRRVPALARPCRTPSTCSLATFAPVATPVALTAPLAAGAARTYKVTVGLDASATNADQAMAATQPITFNFGS